MLKNQTARVEVATTSGPLGSGATDVRKRGSALRTELGRIGWLWTELKSEAKQRIEKKSNKN